MIIMEFMKKFNNFEYDALALIKIIEYETVKIS